MKMTRMIGAAAVAALASLAAPAAAHANTATCAGTTTFTSPPLGYTSTVHGTTTVEDFDFTADHILCLADGSVVTASMVGHIHLVTGDDATGRVKVDATVSIPGGTLQSKVHTKFGPASFDARVHVSGGTGVLAGMSGHGTTVMTGPGSFVDTIEYEYR